MTRVIPSAEDIGIVESRSAGAAGIWKMGGRSIEATATTKP